jgi:lysophospholipase
MKNPDGKLLAIEGIPIPPGAESGLVETPDGKLLRFAIWQPPKGSRKGTVCVFQGRGEFIEKYLETAGDLQARGYGVAIFDWRGQGGSGAAGRVFFEKHISSFEEYEEDLTTFMLDVVLPDCAPPYHAIAHSTGGLPLVKALVRRHWFERVILTAPLLALASPTIPWKLVHFLVGTVSALGFGGLALPGRSARSFAATPFFGNAFTSDEERFDRIKRIMREYPYLTSKRPRIGWLNAAFNAMAQIRALPEKSDLRAPVLVVSSRRDTVVSIDAAETFAARIANATNIVIDGAQHEILLERDELREQFWAAFESFFEGVQPKADTPGQKAGRRNPDYC